MNKRIRFLKEKIAEIENIAQKENRNLLEREKREIKRIQREINEMSYLI